MGAATPPGAPRMFAGLPLTDLAWLGAALLAAGAATGLLAGVFGVGGGAVVVPVLYELFRAVGVPDEARMPLCVGTSLAVIIPTSIRSFNAHRAQGMVDLSILRRWAVPVVAGVAIGSLVARYAPADLFKAVFVLVAGISAVRLLFGRDGWRLGTELPGRVLMNLYGLVIGVLSVVLTGGVLAALAVYGSAQAQGAAAYLLVWFLLLSGPRPVWELQRSRRAGRAPTSDADQLGRLTAVPAVLWVGAFFLVTVGAAAGGAWLLAQPVT